MGKTADSSHKAARNDKLKENELLLFDIAVPRCQSFLAGESDLAFGGWRRGLDGFYVLFDSVDFIHQQVED